MTEAPPKAKTGTDPKYNEVVLAHVIDPNTLIEPDGLYTALEFVIMATHERSRDFAFMEETVALCIEGIIVLTRLIAAADLESFMVAAGHETPKMTATRKNLMKRLQIIRGKIHKYMLRVSECAHAKDAIN